VTSPPPPVSVDPPDPVIVHHYLFTLLVQAAVLTGLVWLAAHYR